MAETTVENPDRTLKFRSRFIYVAGADGTGKTTLASAIIDELQANDIKCKHVWLRFPRFFSLPLLAYARLRGYSYFEEFGRTRYGYWEFSRSWVMSRLFPWAMLADAFLTSLLRVRLPMILGHTIVCERFALDMLVDLAVALENASFWQYLPGRLFFTLIPSKSRVVVLHLDRAVVWNRRPALRHDRSLASKQERYLQLARESTLAIMSTELDVKTLVGEIMSTEWDEEICRTSKPKSATTT